MTARRLDFYADEQRDSRVRMRLSRRELLPKTISADIRLSEMFPADVLRSSISMPCQGCEPHLTVIDDERFWADLSAKHAAAAIERWVRDMLFASNLVWPGVGGLVYGLVRRSGRTVHTLKAEVPSVLLDARVTAKEYGWPTFRELKFEPTWLWLRRQPGFNSRFGGGPIGRALNAFSHITRGLADPAVELMWAMIGIEALFTRGGSALLDQVRERSRLLIGDSPGARKLVSRMYEVRSRFVHGDLDFAGEHRRESFGRAEPDETSLRETTRMGVAILLASIQEVAARGWSNLEFKTELASA